jgi:hypothetical protein
MNNVIKLTFKKRISKSDSDHIKARINELSISDEARAELSNALYKVTETSGRRWVFVMINPDQFLYVMKATASTSKPDFNWRIFTIAIMYIRMDTGEIMADREQLSKDAGALPRDVSTAMTELAKIGAIIKEKRGRKTAYFINPNVGWAGGEGVRQEAAKGVPKLRLVAGGKVELTGEPVAYTAPKGLLAETIQFLRNADVTTRRRWAKRAVAHGAPAMPGMEDRKHVASWAKWVVIDMSVEGALPPEPEDGA